MRKLFEGDTDQERRSLNPLKPSFGINIDKQRLQAKQRSALASEIPVAVCVERTTFLAVYGVTDGVVELMSADFGEGRALLLGRLPKTVAKDLLQTMATEEILRTDVPFMPDHGYADLMSPSKREETAARSEPQLSA